jgi:hypothetical protein
MKMGEEGRSVNLHYYVNMLLHCIVRIAPFKHSLHSCHSHGQIIQHALLLYWTNSQHACTVTLLGEFTACAAVLLLMPGLKGCIAVSAVNNMCNLASSPRLCRPVHMPDSSIHVAACTMYMHIAGWASTSCKTINGCASTFCMALIFTITVSACTFCRTLLAEPVKHIPQTTADDIIYHTFDHWHSRCIWCP